MVMIHSNIQTQRNSIASPMESISGMNPKLEKWALLLMKEKVTLYIKQQQKIEQLYLCSDTVAQFLYGIKTTSAMDKVVLGIIQQFQ